MKRQTRSASNGDIPHAVLDMDYEKSDESSPKKVRKRVKCNLIKEFLIDYTSNSSLHGLKYIGEKQGTWVEKVFWLLMFTCSFFICSVVIWQVYIKWKDGPDIVSFTANSLPVWMIPYPAVTVCFETKAMQSKYNFTKYYHLYNGSDTHANLTEYERNEFEDVSLVCDSHLSPVNGRKFGKGIETVNTLKEVGVSQHNRSFFRLQMARREQGLLSDLFSPILTEEGICYTFNTLGADDLLRVNNLHTDYQYLEMNENSTAKISSWTLEKGYPYDTPIETYPHRGSGYGAKAGLIFILKATEVDLDYLCRGPVQGYKILLHNPAELPRLSQQYFRAPFSQEVVVAVKPKLTTTSDGLLPYSPYIRKCFFPSERYLQYFKIYTQANCEMECLSNFTYARCGCVHFGMLYGPNMTVCNAGSIPCVQNAQLEMVTVAVQTSLDSEHAYNNTMNDTLREARKVAMRCTCMPACTSIEYEAETSQADFDWRAIFTSFQFPVPPEFYDTYMTRIFIFFKEAQFMVSLRSELYGSQNLLASCGGVLGLFMGFSFLSVVEIIYFLTIRLCCVCWRKKPNKRVANKTKTKLKHAYID